MIFDLGVLIGMISGSDALTGMISGSLTHSFLDVIDFGKKGMATPCFVNI